MIENGAPRPPKWNPDRSPDPSFPVLAILCFRATLLWFCYILWVRGSPGRPKTKRKRAPCTEPCKKQQKNTESAHLVPKGAENDLQMGTQHCTHRSLCPSCWAPGWQKRPGWCLDGQKSAPGLKFLRKSRQNPPISPPVPEKKKAVICP